MPPVLATVRRAAGLIFVWNEPHPKDRKVRPAAGVLDRLSDTVCHPTPDGVRDRSSAATRFASRPVPATRVGGAADARTHVLGDENRGRA
jgi:hypothetical protein